MQQKIDMAEVLKYPLTPVPLCLSHVDGSVNSTPKSNLLNYIDSQFVTVPPSSTGHISRNRTISFKSIKIFAMLNKDKNKSEIRLFY